jgi:hypothetical protein
MFTSPSHLRPSRYARRHSGAIAVLLAASGLCCGGDDPSDVPTPSMLEAIAGDGQTGRVSQELPDPLIVRVLDQSGNPVAGVNVAWAAQGGGSVSPETVPSDADGTSSVRRFLGPSPGEQTTTAAVSGLQGSPVTFTSTAIDEGGPPSPP